MKYDVFIDIENLKPELVENLPLTEFESMDYRSLNALYRLYPDVYARLQAESEAKREKIISDRNYRCSGNYVPPKRSTKKITADPNKPDRTRMSYNEWQDYCDRQAGIEPYRTKTYKEWLDDMKNPTTLERRNG